MSASSFDAGDYPRVYRASATMRRTVRWVAGLLMAVVLLGVILSASGIIRNPNSPLFVAFEVIAFGGAALYLVCAVERRSVTLYPDAIEVAGLFGTRRLARSEIRGRRIAKRARIGPIYRLVSTDGSAPDLKLPPFLQPDALFHAWMRDIPRIP